MILKNKEKKENNFLEFIVESDAQEFIDAITAAYKREKNKISIPGFRKGKAPLAVIEGMYGPEVFWQGALDELAQAAFEAGIEQGEIKMIGMPSIIAADVTPDTRATYTFSVELYPEVKLGQYRGVEVTKPDLKVSKAEVDKEVEQKRKQNARMLSVEDRAAKMGDTCNIDFDGFLDAEKTQRFDGGKAEGYDLELGSNSFVPGFEEQIVGMNVGDVKDINIKFPEDYVEDLAGKDVVFSVKVNEIKEEQLPELDDEFAKDVSEFDTLKEFVASVKKDLEQRKAEQAKATLRNEAILKACDNMKAEVPETMVRAHIDAIIRNFASNYGISDPQIGTETLASMLGIDENTMNTAIRPSALMEAKTELLVNAVIAKEKIEATEEKLNEYINKISGTVGATVEDIKNYFGMDYITEEFKKEEALSLIADSAVEVEAAKPEKKTAKKPAAKKTEEKPEEAEKAEKPAKKAPAKKAPAKKAPAEKEEK